MENLKQIDSFRDYFIDHHGNVWSNKGDRLKILKYSVNKFGYRLVVLSSDNSRKCKQVHRLVAESFIPNPENKRTVNHKDGNKQNNHIHNLEWATHSENNLHSFKLGRTPGMLGKSGHTKLTKRIAQFSKSNLLIRNWDSIRDAERKGGFDRTGIISCCKGRLKTHSGFIWKYIQ